jgi:hypothetical protein
MEEALKKNPVSEDLKNTSPMEWAGRMENLKSQAEEIVTMELICTEPSPEQQRMDALRERLDSIPKTGPDPSWGFTEEEVEQMEREEREIPF